MIVAVVCTFRAAMPIKDSKVQKIGSDLFDDKSVFIVRPPALDGMRPNPGDEDLGNWLAIIDTGFEFKGQFRPTVPGS